MKNIIVSLLLLTYVVNSYAASIMIDVGHNLKQQGTISAYGDYEFNYNRLFVRDLYTDLKPNHEVNVVGFLGDVMSLQARTVNTANYDMFLSIHHDAIQSQHLKKWTYNGKEQIYNDEVRGFGIFVSEKNPFFKQSLHCAMILSQELVKRGFQPNLYHALDIKNERKQLYSKNAVYRYDNLVVLKTARSPAMLIEVGVLTNREEVKDIVTKEFRNKFNEAIGVSLKQCLIK